MITAQDALSTAKGLYEVFNQRKFDELPRLVAPTCTWTNVATGQTYKGPEGYGEWAKTWVGNFSDARIDIQNQFTNGEWVTTLFTGGGTNDGPMQTPKGAVPATQRKMKVSFCEVVRVTDGKIVEAKIYFDTLTMMQQLGLA